MLDFKKYKRFFAFGCSMTCYNWPTWADIIAQEIPKSLNFGQSGAGNIFISSMVAEANMRYKFNEDDLVIVMWSTTNREDRYYERRWQTYGNLYNQPFYSKQFIKDYVDHRGQLIRDLSLISLTKLSLDNIGCDYHMFTMQPLNCDLVTGYQYDDVIELYAPLLDELKISLLVDGCDGTWIKTPIKRKSDNHWEHDYHPSPKIHFSFIKKIFPDQEWNDETIKFVNKYENEVQSVKFLEELTYRPLKPNIL